MKKEVKSKSRRKWVFGGVLAFASVCLITTGFATWIISASVTESDHDVTIAVDSATNSSAVLTVSLDDDQIRLTENYTKETYTNAGGSGTCYVTNDSGTETDLSIVADISLTAGNSYNLSNLTVSWYAGDATADPAVPAETNQNASGNDRIDNRDEANNTYTYVDIVTQTINVPTQSYTENQDEYVTTNDDGTTTYHWDNYEIKFNWGTWFNNQSPCTYYNAYLNDNHAVSDKFQAVTDELNDMYTQYTTDSDLKITIAAVGTISNS